MKKLARIAGLIMITGLLFSFKGDDKVLKNGDKWIPEGFDTRHSTLLVENWDLGVNSAAGQKASDRVTDKMKVVVKEKYTYPYEFASAEDINSNAKYADKEKYRYVLACTNRTVTNHETGFSHSSNDFHILDRKTGKSYPNTGYSAGYVTDVLGPVLNTIMKYLKDLK